MALAAIVAGSLASCSTARIEVPPPGPTTGQVDSMMQDWAARQSSAYSEHILGWQRPVAFEAFLPAKDRTGALAKCIGQVSFGAFDAVADRRNLDTADGPRGVALLDYASAVCGIRFPPPSIRARLRTPQQLDYTYDYYVNDLVPCLRKLGIGVNGMPSARDFREDSYDGLEAWSPFAALDVANPPSPPLAVLESTCSPTPPGLPG